ncbi:MAG TPA: hypothetical protein VJV96_18195 [Candidatus Angelobacter sp.]|nr:hypothetical protein [Candidatus Angelobacter sp.]
MSASALNLLVFREGRRRVCGEELGSRLRNQVVRLGPAASSDELLTALLRAGELECGTADAECSPESAQKVTDELAESLVGGKSPGQQSLLRLISDLCPPNEISISVPEGFAYYALHPLAYSDVVTTKLTNLGSRAAVLGIRSIGTTLSAMVAAGLRKQGKKASRITVRPHGHPYNRELHLSGEQQEFVARALAEDADFLVVDEGPGLSGSSFLSVAEALAAQHVPRQKITLICGHEPDFGQFRASNGQRRAQNFRWVAVDATARRPKQAMDFIGGGNWRARQFADRTAWPEAWTSFERLKYISSPGETQARLFKFLGLGHYGDEAFQRELRVAQAGFGPEPRSESDGFASYPWVNARPMSAADLSQDVLRRLAEYCAFRAKAFPAREVVVDGLQQMAEHNLKQLGIKLRVTLQLERPVIADGRMQPHEWLIAPDGQMLKTDSGSHGDDHFFPGPTDIAWDLAGAIVEWRMNQQQIGDLLAQYGRISGDDAAARIDDFIVAYNAFRAAYCLMASNALNGGDEAIRMQSASENYRNRLLVRAPAAMATGS